MEKKYPAYILWSTDRIDSTDPFQRRWLLRQTLLHGRAEDIRQLNFDEVERELDNLDLPPEIEALWHAYLERRHANR